MLFSSLIFLFYGLPISLILYYVAPKKARNFVLLLISLIFYGWCGTGYLLLLITSILINFFIAKRIEISADHSKKWLSLGIILNCLLLVGFKYTNFILEGLNQIFHFKILQPNTPFISIALPLGISFYTFHQLSMLRDIYNDRLLPKVSIVPVFLYVTLFPQLIAGPIVRYKEVIYQIQSRKESLSQFYQGLQLFIVGLIKKVVLANGLALVADQIMNSNAEILSTEAAWLGIIAYSLQIYFDFSGYSDMALGLGHLFGFQLPKNFNYPYIATSIKDFWRRWHISLSSWFRDYVYIPLGGNQLGVKRLYLNLISVFILTGLWHGASLSFVFWGLFHGLFLILERMGLENTLLKIPPFFRWCYTILVVMIGWVFFRITDFTDALEYIFVLFKYQHLYKISSLTFLDNESLLVLIVAVFFALRKAFKVPIPHWLINFKEIVFNLFLLLLFGWCVMKLAVSSYNPFIYFNF